MWAEGPLQRGFGTLYLGGPGHAPLENFENAYSQRCIFLDFGSKIKGIQDRLTVYQVTSNKVMMNWSVDCFYCLLYNNQINARTLIGQSAVGYYARKPTEKSRVF